MANQRRLADNVAHFEAGHAGVPRKGAALLQGIAICGRCGRRMSMRYTGPNADYPVYCCRSDRDQEGSALCQEVRALAVDALVQRVVLDALLPDQIEIALAAANQLEQESRQLERQWALRVERARYEAERARRQYDAVEPENRLVARSLERAWEEKLRAVEAVAQTVFDYLARGLLTGRQLAKGQPWQIELSDEQISQLRHRVRRTKRSKKEAS